MKRTLGLASGVAPLRCCQEQTHRASSRLGLLLRGCISRKCMLGALESPRTQLDTRRTGTPSHHVGQERKDMWSPPNPHLHSRKRTLPTSPPEAGPTACRQVTQVYPVAPLAPGCSRRGRAGRTGPTLPWRSWSLSLIQSHLVWLLSQHLLLWAKSYMEVSPGRLENPIPALASATATPLVWELRVCAWAEPTLQHMCPQERCQPQSATHAGPH